MEQDGFLLKEARNRSAKEEEITIEREESCEEDK